LSQTLETIRFYFESKPSYVADPHTAVGLSAARLIADQVPSSGIQVVLSTAHPAKFSEAVAQALQSFSTFDFERDILPEEFKGLLEKEKRVIDVPAAEVDLVKSVIEKHADSE
jgi:threonine synthase